MTSNGQSSHRDRHSALPHCSRREPHLWDMWRSLRVGKAQGACIGIGLMIWLSCCCWPGASQLITVACTRLDDKLVDQSETGIVSAAGPLIHGRSTPRSTWCQGTRTSSRGHAAVRQPVLLCAQDHTHTHTHTSRLDTGQTTAVRWCVWICVCAGQERGTAAGRGPRRQTLATLALDHQWLRPALILPTNRSDEGHWTRAIGGGV